VTAPDDDIRARAQALVDSRTRVDAVLGFDVDDAELLRGAARDVRRVDPRLATIGHTALAEALDRAAARAEGDGALALAVREWVAASLVVDAARARVEAAEATSRASDTVLDEAETDAGRRLAQEIAERDGEALDEAVVAGHTALDRLDELSQRVRALAGVG